jgi:hypothetical protein
VIEGVRIELSSEELRQTFVDRASWHYERAMFYEDQVDSLRRGGVNASGVTNDPVSSLENSARQHKDRQAYFTFLAAHLIPDETYRLSEQDLTRLELLARYLP